MAAPLELMRPAPRHLQAKSARELTTGALTPALPVSLDLSAVNTMAGGSGDTFGTQAFDPNANTVTLLLPDSTGTAFTSVVGTLQSVEHVQSRDIVAIAGTTTLGREPAWFWLDIHGDGSIIGFVHTTDRYYRYETAADGQNYVFEIEKGAAVCTWPDNLGNPGTRGLGEESHDHHHHHHHDDQPAAAPAHDHSRGLEVAHPRQLGANQYLIYLDTAPCGAGVTSCSIPNMGNGQQQWGGSVSNIQFCNAAFLDPTNMDALVAEVTQYYSAFDVTVTRDPNVYATWVGNKCKAGVVKSLDYGGGGTVPCDTGIAYVNVYNTANCLAWASCGCSGNSPLTGEVITHEIGHTLG